MTAAGGICRCWQAWARFCTVAGLYKGFQRSDESNGVRQGGGRSVGARLPASLYSRMGGSSFGLRNGDLGLQNAQNVCCAGREGWRFSLQRGERAELGLTFGVQNGHVLLCALRGARLSIRSFVTCALVARLTVWLCTHPRARASMCATSRGPMTSCQRCSEARPGRRSGIRGSGEWTDPRYMYHVITHNGEPPGSRAGHFEATRKRV